MWDNFPTMQKIPLSGKGKELVLFMFGSTNAMQSFVVNARIAVNYADGGCEKCNLIEQLNFDDLMVPAFQQKYERFYWANGNHGFVVRIPLDAAKNLKDFTMEAVANEVIAGLLGAAVVR